MVDPVVTGALIWLVQRLLDKGFDRIFDAFDSPKQAPSPFQPAQAPMVAPQRHDLSVDGAQGTSDVDIDVRHHPHALRAPVILTFQKFGTTSGGATFPMELGDTAHLTLRRDHYLIAALVMALPRTAGAKPTLRGVGWTQEWVAANQVRKVAIATQHPTAELVTELGLTKSDGSCPFILPPAPTRTAAPNLTANAVRWKFDKENPFDKPRLTDARSPQTPLARFGGGRFSALTCRARTGLPNERCTSLVHADKLCLEHWRSVRNGHPLHDFQTGERLWTS